MSFSLFPGFLCERAVRCILAPGMIRKKSGFAVFSNTQSEGRETGDRILGEEETC